jgi:hypothetical protein
MTAAMRSFAGFFSSERASGFLIFGLFAAAYLALAADDTMLLAPSRAAAAENTQDQAVLEWVGAASHVQQFDLTD